MIQCLLFSLLLLLLLSMVLSSCTSYYLTIRTFTDGHSARDQYIVRLLGKQREPINLLLAITYGDSQQLAVMQLSRNLLGYNRSLLFTVCDAPESGGSSRIESLWQSLR